ncbi:MAG TPA: peptidoglycan DD-metalloendopeptidase family protein [Sedimentibacter sp.]|jgi:murein DD-endopeptidase MepM/ murein hydrolase activator NlpD|nr:peptidoglycan DD-metalloendopeptidase family protein [Sedimentibacter sp.]NLA12858.1 peptidoglycan DD-metalloendopeptidase family protein [Tissierellia bacterium]HOA19342.1 peptidoglycan DD-metalloendopeptidase family protein [Sedimentibacter sp.]HOG63565.1 peptidoglycan DD-metalloendopeptidase family protein [Sedimentibacter sp.]HOT21394.1 peptidoglycan DD-metalloendopeptidase family protein [Sedimentibacter sp.]
MFRKCVAVILLIITIIGIFPANAGGSIADLRYKQKQIEQQIKDIRKKAEELKGEKKSIEAEIQILDSELRALTLETEKQEVQKQELNMRIAESEQKIAELTDEIDKNNMLLEQRLRAMYMNGTGGYLEVILNAENLIDALTRMDLIQLIVKSDVELLKTINEQKKEVEELKAAQEIRRHELTAVINDLNIKQNEVLIASRSKENYMSSLQNNIEEILRQEAAMEEQSKQIEKDIIALQRAVEYAGGELLWPLPGHYRITSEYGGRIHPITGVWSTHGGTDIAAPYGTNILSSNDGVVIYAGYHYSYGNYIIVDHGGGIATLYAHCSKLLASEGQAVTKGEPIAKVGSTGESTGNHLHYEVRLNGVRKNPMEYLK